MDWRLAFILSIFSLGALGGPVNAPDSFPMAAMNQRGDFLMAGNWSGLLRWDSHYFRLKPPLDRRSSSYFSGGLAASEQSPLQAVVCGGSKAYGFLAKTKTWQPLLELPLMA